MPQPPSSEWNLPATNGISTVWQTWNWVGTPRGAVPYAWVSQERNSEMAAMRSGPIEGAAERSSATPR